ncbi:MAG: class I SAM-dependent methyltransferase [Clostridia bacterium]|nr:class I SAM-dependent methyltransferase [Clostridia bacterium]
MDRIERLCAFLDCCRVFADVACDHGYCAEYMLKNGLCESAVISDISEKSLAKAEKLLSEFTASGKCRAVCCDGLENIDGADEVLIAGIGGAEIIKILQNAYIPEKFIFQPMKNAKALRKYLLQSGCKIICDDLFTDGKKYYFVIKGTRTGGGQSYLKAQLEYGKDSLFNPVLKSYIKEELSKKRGYLMRGLSESAQAEIQDEIRFMEEVLREVDRNT